jgi:hopanoid biosynthesis associated protein HpnK
MKTLIINGDDFGISSSTNQAVLRAHREGILTSASLMVNGAAFEEAVALARAHLTLSVGIHLVLVHGKSTLPPKEIPDLVNERGEFSRNPVAAGMAYFFSPSLKAQIRKELEAQIKKFLSTGLSLAHLNGHINIHVHPTVLGVLMELGERYGVKKIRLPQEELFVTLRLDRNRWLEKLVQWMIFESLSLSARRRLTENGFRIPDHAYGLLEIGRMGETYLLGLLDRIGIGEGCFEISFHLGEAPSDWPAFYDGRQELSALLSKAVRDKIKRSGLKLISYTDL